MRWRQILALLGFGSFLAPSQCRYLTFDLVADFKSDTLDKPLTSEISYSLISGQYLRRVLIDVCQQDSPVMTGLKNCVCVLVKVQYQLQEKS